PVAEEEIVEPRVLAELRDAAEDRGIRLRVGVRARVPPARRIRAERAHHGADDERPGHDGTTSAAGVLPTATSLPRVFDHWLHEPGYTVTSTPATAPASAVWVAAIPEPQ